MSESVDSTFLQQINQNLGIAHKICLGYFQDAEDRADAFQEMMYQLWRSYESFQGDAKFSTWMYRVCLNTAMTYKRKSRKNTFDALSDRHDQMPASPSVNNEEELGLLFKAIATLSPVNKAVVLLYLEDLSYEEIAGITGLSKSNVSVKMFRIKKELEVLLKKMMN
ncbi:sigma-70 family RNA polymerase sigma factor [Imperialibacter roseus]|uniref:Sigma-70 family RNA polymerase sigma factor n=1 Tax=Imperialibacter roseus TaxID=1324217 RepID=A0ABZ0INF4_9BACT|nr:sigma-70 family RNA polymerase sigma factor [Imperialibacter roseus]WOK05699.1 sigma-70 family RNA polymerase sigma factor [Imperialibacter roseus]